MPYIKQTKITKLFQRAPRLPEEDCDDLQEEVSKLEQTLKEKQDLLFQLQRSKLKCARAPPKKKSELFVGPQKLMLTTSVDALKREIELMSMLSGVEVQSYVTDEHCSIIYHMQHHSDHEIKHGLKITMKNGANEVSESSLPLGFNLSAVLESFDKVMQPDCLLSVRKALVAFYDRLDQYDKLEKLVNMEAQLFKMLDGSQIQITFLVRNEMEEEPRVIEVTLKLEYRIYDIRPKQYSFIIDIDDNEEIAELLKNQSAIFKKKPLYQAFKHVFIDGDGPFTMVPRVGNLPAVERRRRKPRPARRPPHPHNDDTFQPEDCSESDDDDVEN